MANDEKENQSRGTNKRQQRRESDNKLLLLVIFVLVVVGSVLIALIFGRETFLTSVPCLLGGALLILVPWGLLTLAEKWRDRMDI
ncbi:MAG: hypothetical protein KC441_06785 [Anaerolineales bacterium]|nr:hypothetical protein [Anaerolineales bacterium]